MAEPAQLGDHSLTCWGDENGHPHLTSQAGESRKFSNAEGALEIYPQNHKGTMGTEDDNLAHIQAVVRHPLL